MGMCSAPASKWTLEAISKHLIFPDLCPQTHHVSLALCMHAHTLCALRHLSEPPFENPCCDPDLTVEHEGLVAS